MLRLAQSWTFTDTLTVCCELPEVASIVTVNPAESIMSRLEFGLVRRRIFAVCQASEIGRVGAAGFGNAGKKRARSGPASPRCGEFEELIMVRSSGLRFISSSFNTPRA